MLGSISGQNMPWTQYRAYPALSVSNASQDGGWASINANAAASGVTAGSAIGGGTGPMLSGQMDLALLALAGGTRESSQVTGQSGDTASTDPAAASTTQDSDLSKIFADLKSLFASFASAAGSSGSSTGTSDTKSAGNTSSSVSNSGTSSTADIGGQLTQDLQQLATDLSTASLSSGSTTSTTSGPQSPPPPPSGPSPWDNDMTNSGTVTAGASGSGSSTVSQGYDRFWQQFVLSAYAATATNGTPASSSTNISA